MPPSSKNSIMNEKISNLKGECNRLYDQITELRTTIQEVYGEIAESDRFFTAELLRVSERLENMAKDLSGITHKTNNSPDHLVVKVNPITNVNSTVSDSQNITDEAKKEESSINYLDKKSISIAIAVLIGFFVSVGALCLFVYKIINVLQFLN